MGIKQSKPISDQESPQMSHPRFSNCRMIKKEQQDFIQISVPVATQNEFKIWETQLKNSPNNTQPYMVPCQFKFSKEGLCGSSGFVTILYDNFPYLLADQIFNRQSMNNKYFQENQLWYLAYTMLSAASGCHENGKKLGDIRPQNIFINEDGQVKVGTIFSWPGETTNYLKTFYEKQTTFLAPQQIKDIHFGKMQSTANFEEAQTFSIGLTLLDAATLQDSKTLYIKGLKFDYEKLQINLNKLKQAGYSEIFCILIQNMCEINQENRETCTSLYKWLRPYEQSIVGLEDFQINGIPMKLSASHQRSRNSSYQNTVVQVSNVKSNQSPMRIGQNPSMQDSPVHRKVQESFQKKSNVGNTNGSKVGQQVQTSKKQTAYQYNKQVGYSNYDNAGKSDILSKIDQQLEISRKMFPGD